MVVHIKPEIVEAQTCVEMQFLLQKIHALLDVTAAFVTCAGALVVTARMSRSSCVQKANVDLVVVKI